MDPALVAAASGRPARFSSAFCLFSWVHGLRISWKFSGVNDRNAKLVNYVGVKWINVPNPFAADGSALNKIWNR